MADNKGTKAKKKWYKRWWVWVIIAVVVVIILPAMFGGSGSSDDNTQKTAKGSSTAKSSAPATPKTISFDNGEKKIVSQVTYPVKMTDTSWAGTTVNIDKARIIRVKPFKDDGDHKTYQGIVLVHFIIKATRDISIYPTQGTLITSDGQQTNGDQYDSDDFDGDIGKGVTKDGNVAFELPKMTDPKSIKTLRLKWDADYDSDNMEDNGQYKTYDLTINLK